AMPAARAETLLRQGATSAPATTFAVGELMTLGSPPTAFSIVIANAAIVSPDAMSPPIAPDLESMGIAPYGSLLRCVGTLPTPPMTPPLNGLPMQTLTVPGP